MRANSGCNCFLADVEMDVTGELAGFRVHPKLFFGTANSDHDIKHRQQLCGAWLIDKSVGQNFIHQRRFS
jgi:hypothetical protein